MIVLFKIRNYRISYKSKSGSSFGLVFTSASNFRNLNSVNVYNRKCHHLNVYNKKVSLFEFLQQKVSFECLQHKFPHLNVNKIKYSKTSLSCQHWDNSKTGGCEFSERLLHVLLKMTHFEIWLSMYDLNGYV